MAVIFGGTSSEHAISCLTAGGVLSAIDRDRYDVVGLGHHPIRPLGRRRRLRRWRSCGLVDGRLPELTEDAADAILLRSSSGTDLAVRESSALSQLGPVDVAFALLHGPFGEDGTIQGMFEMMGTRYVGAGVLASAVGMDKVFMKLVLSASGLPVGPFVADPAARSGDATETPAWRRSRRCTIRSSSSRPEAGRAWGSAGSTRPSELVAADRARAAVRPEGDRRGGHRRSPRVRVRGAGPVRTADPPRPAWSARSGCTPASTTSTPSTCPRSRSSWTCPADVDADIAEQVRALAVRTFEALGCEGLARVDVFLTRDRKVIVNEINTMPGFTAHVDVPADVGRQRRRLPGTGRPAPAAGAAAPGRPALVRMLRRGRDVWALPSRRDRPASRSMSSGSCGGHSLQDRWQTDALVPEGDAWQSSSTR